MSYTDWNSPQLSAEVERIFPVSDLGISFLRSCLQHLLTTSAIR